MNEINLAEINQWITKIVTEKGEEVIFAYVEGEWCIFGVVDGWYWESEYFQTAKKEEALAEAIFYLKTHNKKELVLERL